ncbi:hypothetical protein BGLA2_2400004 [Burkholderia gladioli]|nr:hypothetical protein BGLA2_2400004 [Burkholderia gladioli]
MPPGRHPALRPLLRHLSRLPPGNRGALTHLLIS